MFSRRSILLAYVLATFSSGSHAQQIGNTVPESMLQGPSFALQPNKPQRPGDDVRAAYIRGLQQMLPSHGYGAGPPSGKIDPATASAISAYQRDAGIRQGTDDLAVLKETLDHLSFSRPGIFANGRHSAPVAVIAPQAAPGAVSTNSDRIRSVQERLIAKGYDIMVSGELDPPTINAIKAFEAGSNLPRDGVISDALIAKLQN